MICRQAMPAEKPCLQRSHACMSHYFHTFIEKKRKEKEKAYAVRRDREASDRHIHSLPQADEHY